MSKAIFAGSFDPITKGHVDIICRAAALFDEVFVAVCCNTEKRGGMFSSEERLALINAAVSNIPCKDKVSVGICEGLLAEYAQKLGADTVVRGARTGSEYEAEASLAEINRELSGIETVIFPARPELSHMSSTFARDMIIYGKAELALPQAALSVLSEIRK